jgi:hypothetical protein
MFCRILVASVIAIAGLGVAPAIAVASQYANSSEAHADGRFNIPKGYPDYWEDGDRDGDG